MAKYGIRLCKRAICKQESVVATPIHFRNFVPSEKSFLRGHICVKMKGYHGFDNPKIEAFDKMNVED